MLLMLPNNKKYQSGNVFIIILIGILLLSSLLYLFSRGLQQGTGNLTKQQVQVAAQDFINTARIMGNAVDRVRRNACSESDISFVNNTVSGYAHTPVSSTECQVFHEDGGQTIWPGTPNWFSDTTQWRISASGGVVNVGTGDNELFLITEQIDRDICLRIAEILDVIDAGQDMSADDPISLGVFTGSFPTAAAVLGDAANELEGQHTGCYRDAASYFAYHVLLAR